MNKIFIALLAGLFCHVAVAAKMEGKTIVYQKSNGEIRLSPVQGNDQQVKFIMNTNVDMHACEVEGTAVITADSPEQSILQWQDKSQCRITLKWGQAKVNVKASEECNSYCGMNAGNSLNGIYK